PSALLPISNRKQENDFAYHRSGNDDKRHPLPYHRFQIEDRRTTLPITDRETMIRDTPAHINDFKSKTRERQCLSSNAKRLYETNPPTLPIQNRTQDERQQYFIRHI